MYERVKICGFDTNQCYSGNMDSLMLMAKNGDKHAKDEFILANTKLIFSIISKYFRKKDFTEDLFQVGCIGLLKALDNFDLKFNVRFSTYAVPMIIGEIKRYCKDVNSLRVARSIRDTAYKVLKKREELERNSNCEVTIDQIAESLNMAVSEAACALDAVSSTISIYENAYSSDEESLLLVDQLCDKRDNEEKWVEKISLQKALRNLGEREKGIIQMRYFKGKTQIEISQRLKMSQAQVSRLEKNALCKIREFFVQ